MFHSSKKSDTSWYKNPIPWIITITGMSAAFLVGWYIPERAAPGIPPSLKGIRLTGYQFVSPLLICGLQSQDLRNLPESQIISSNVENVINQHKQSGDITKASTFFIDYASGAWSSTNPDEKYYPSSIGKVPIMIAYLDLAEQSRSILDKRIYYSGSGPDLNLSQDIKPEHNIIPGQSYSVSELIDYMIKYSDNNATELLYNDVDQATLQRIYKDLGIPVDYNPSIANIDFITPAQISLLFRILYNATWLSRDDSEAVLQLLSQTSFAQGLVAGVPSSAVVAHKLGLVGITSGGIATEHELHDCGIVFPSSSQPYLLCVMTRGAGSLPAMESTIADISRAVYQIARGNSTSRQ